MTTTLPHNATKANHRRRMSRSRLALLALGGASLIVGMLLGLNMLGLSLFDVPLPVTTERFAQVHAQVMIVGFLGTVIALERAVALRRRWGFLAPLGLGLGALALLTDLPAWVGESGQLAGAAFLIAVYVPLWRRVPSAAVTAQALGAVLLAGALICWLGGVTTAALLPWAVGFLVLTIAGERLELARLGLGGSTRAETTFTILAASVAAAAAAALLWPVVGTAIFGAALLAIVAWLVRHDVARRTIHTVGLPRFTAACLLAGYAWLALAGAVWLVGGPQTSGGGYDLVIHAVFLGFGLSMILGHAPIILPAVLGQPLPYRAFMWVPLVLLEGSLIVRSFGDLRGLTEVWQSGGALNVVAILTFAVVTVSTAIAASRR